MRTWETMVTGQALPPPHFAPEKRKSQDDLNEQPPKRPSAWSPPASRFPLPPINTSQPGIAPGHNGYTLSPSPASPTTSALPRKRGRPSRADMEARTRHRAQHTTGYAPIAPVPGPTVLPPEKPKKKGRRSASERKLQPAALPRRIHELTPPTLHRDERYAAPAADDKHISLGAAMGRPLAPAPRPLESPIQQIPGPPTPAINNGGTDEKETTVSDDAK